MPPLLLIAFFAAAALAQETPPPPPEAPMAVTTQPAVPPLEAAEGMRVRRIEFQGLQTIGEGFARRLITTHEGDLLRREQVQEDVRALLRSRKFLNVEATLRSEDTEIVVIYRVQEKPTVVGVEVDGNRKFTNSQLFSELSFAAGDVLDIFEVNRGRDNILRKYHEEGYHDATVTIDEPLLQNERRVVYHITEGPRVRVRHVRFEGNRSFSDNRLRAKIQTSSYIWVLRKGLLDDEMLDRDVLEIQQYIRDEGFMNARVGRRLDWDVTHSDVTVVFLIEEGDRFRINAITVEGNTVFETNVLQAEMELKIGDFLRAPIMEHDRKRIADRYGSIGYVDATVEATTSFTDEPAKVDVHYKINEGAQSRFGRITVRGNPKTKDEVVRRELRFYPGELYNTVQAKKAEQRIMETGLFRKATITPLQDIEGEREALVEVEEGDTVSFLIGIGVSTDNGIIGSITLENRNFDLFDTPRTWGEFFRGQAFRGDGQRFRIQAEPGTEVSRFRIDFTEPYLFDHRLRYDTSFYLFNRDRGPYEESRVGFLNSLSHRFESGLLNGWALEGAIRLEGVDIDDVDGLAAREIREAKGDHFLTAFKGTVVRDTTDSRLNPSEGYRWSFSWEQVGALGGDYSFGKPSTSFTWYKPLHTDVFDRKSVLALRADAAWIVGDAPVFERYYAGGFGSMRGFSYRGISPRNGVKNDAIGGDFLLLTGGEYSFPLYGKNVRGVTFLDMGTVQEDFRVSAWRASVGFGLRINVDFFGPVPIVLDFGFPIADEEHDGRQVFNFAFGASF